MYTVYTNYIIQVSISFDNNQNKASPAILMNTANRDRPLQTDRLAFIDENDAIDLTNYKTNHRKNITGVYFGK